MSTKAVSANRAVFKKVIHNKITAPVNGHDIVLRRPRRDEIVAMRDDLVSVKDEITEEQNIDLAIQEVEKVIVLCVPGLAVLCGYRTQEEAEAAAVEHEGEAALLEPDHEDSLWGVVRRDGDAITYLFSDGSYRDDPYESEAFDLIMAAGGERSELVQKCFQLCGMATKEVDKLAQEHPTTS